jgi:hypothetical protein
LDAFDEALLDLPRRTAHAQIPEAACELGLGQVSRHLEQSKRNATRLHHDAVAHPLVHPPGDHAVQQLAGVLSDRPPITSSVDRQDVATAIATAIAAAVVADGEHQSDGLGHQAPRDEAKGLHRHLVEPLRVVDDAEQGLVLGGRRHQAQHRQPDEETVRRAPTPRRTRRSALRAAVQELIEVANSGAQSCCSPANASSMSDSTPATCATRNPDDCSNT